jgi:pimeloyl-ACP methyl ester carboxylesterase
MYRARLCAVCALTALVTACNGAAVQEPREESIAFETSDGARIAATWYAVSSPAPPGLIFVHKVGGERSVWEVLARRAQRDGFAGIAIDLRGHGESAAAPGNPATYRQFTETDWRSALHDIGAARRELIARGANADEIAVVGEGIGASLALHHALAEPDCAAIVLISPGLVHHGLGAEDEIVAYGLRPALLVASEGDSSGAAAADTLKARAGGFCELRLYPGAARGASIFATSEQSVEQVLLWLRTVLETPG